MYVVPTVSNKQKIYCCNLFFVWILKATEGKNRIRILIRNPVLRVRGSGSRLKRYRTDSEHWYDTLIHKITGKRQWRKFILRLWKHVPRYNKNLVVEISKTNSTICKHASIKNFKIYSVRVPLEGQIRIRSEYSVSRFVTLKWTFMLQNQGFGSALI